MIRIALRYAHLETLESGCSISLLPLAFANSARLQKHVRFLYSRGGMYLVYNAYLLYRVSFLREGQATIP